LSDYNNFNFFNNYNLLKSGWVTVNVDDKRIINSDERLAAHREKESREAPVRAARGAEQEESPDGFVGGLHADQVEGLFGEAEDGGLLKVQRQKEEAEEQEETLQALLKQAEDELALTEIQIARMKQEAQADIEVMRRVVAEEARGKGYAEGFEKGAAEIEKLRANLREDRRKLQMEYDRRVDELEPQFVDLITGIYEQIFHVELKQYGPIVAHLISNTMRNSGENKDFIVHVAKADYEYVSGQKEEIRTYAVSGRSTLEIIEDITLSPGDCMIETDGGIFDCSLGTQMAGLHEKLKLLSYEK
jgi:flagellar assembly protein FliH